VLARKWVPTIDVEFIFYVEHEAVCTGGQREYETGGMDRVCAGIGAIIRLAISWASVMLISMVLAGLGGGLGAVIDGLVNGR
jgi:hypothetical protein